MSIDSLYFPETYQIAEGQTRFKFTFEFILPEYVEVYKVTPGTGDIEALWVKLVYNTDYTVETGEYRDPIFKNGTVVLLGSPTFLEGQYLSIQRKTEISNEQQFPEERPFKTESFEFGVDKLTMILQEIDARACDCRGVNGGGDGSGIPTFDCASFDEWTASYNILIGGPSPRFGLTYNATGEPLFDFPFESPAKAWYSFDTSPGVPVEVTNFTTNFSVLNQIPGVEEWNICDGVINQLVFLNMTPSSGEFFGVSTEVYKPSMSCALIATRYRITEEGVWEAFDLTPCAVYAEASIWGLFTSNPTVPLELAFVRGGAFAYFAANRDSGMLEVRLNTFDVGGPELLATLDSSEYIDGRFAYFSVELSLRLSDLYPQPGQPTRSQIDLIVDYNITVGRSGFSGTTESFSGSRVIVSTSVDATVYSELEGRIGQQQLRPPSVNVVNPYPVILNSTAPPGEVDYNFSRALIAAVFADYVGNGVTSAEIRTAWNRNYERVVGGDDD
jgi:hypothetical protein